MRLSSRAWSKSFAMIISLAARNSWAYKQKEDGRISAREDYPWLWDTKIILIANMRTSIFNSSVPGHIQANFRTIDNLKMNLIEQSLRSNYFVRFPEGYLSTEWGRNDLENHLYRRLEMDRNIIIPWLDESRPLRNSSVLEIGCGTGCSSVALAEQGAEVTAIDVDEHSLIVASERCRAYGLEASFAHANAMEVNKLFSGKR